LDRAFPKPVVQQRDRSHCDDGADDQFANDAQTSSVLNCKIESDPEEGDASPTDRRIVFSA
jgi:hypothetical protein